MTDPKICDLCGGPDVQWSWLTPNKITREEAEAGQGIFFEDPEWLICDPCHHLVLDDRQDVLNQRAILNMPSPAEAGLGTPFEKELIDELQRLTIRELHQDFWDNKTEYSAIQED